MLPTWCSAVITRVGNSVLRENYHDGMYPVMEKLRTWRQSVGLTAEEAGNLIGVSNVQWGRIENGTRQVAADKVLEVERVTGISRHDLRPDVFGKRTPTPSDRSAA